MGLVLRLLVTLVTANRRRDKAPELEASSGTVDALRIVNDQGCTRLPLSLPRGGSSLVTFRPMVKWSL
jgi:hypothetical protein